MDNLDEFYRAYGESLASRLAAIAHSPARPAFVFVADVDNPVEVMSFIGNAKLKTSGPILVWDGFGESLNTSGRDNYHLPLVCSFSIIQKATDQASQATKAMVYAQCRQIALKALALMIRDAEAGILLENQIQLGLRQFPMEKTGPHSATWYGYNVEFEWLAPVDLSLSPEDLV